MGKIFNSYITPPGEGFQPRDTAHHHQREFVGLTKQALEEAGTTINTSKFRKM